MIVLQNVILIRLMTMLIKNILLRLLVSFLLINCLTLIYLSMNNIEFLFRGKFGDEIRFVCVCQTSFGSITRGYLYTVYMYINNFFRKTYDNILATSYTDLNTQINLLFNNY